MVFQLIGVLIVAAILALVLMVAVKIVFKQHPDYGDAFKTALVALVAEWLLGMTGMFEPDAGGAVLQIIVSFFIWAVVISMFMAFTIGRSLLVALVFTVLTWIAMILLAILLGTREEVEAGAAPSGHGSMVLVRSEPGLLSQGGGGYTLAPGFGRASWELRAIGAVG
ncbi:MAG: hypothetical protein MK116_11340 [Phycisphaerales bacterium]|nr:hypothetical protein [Phycisphaerales bacterium]